MKHLLLIVYLFFFTCISLFGQVNQVWWSKGRVLHVNPVAGIDSVTFGQFVNADTFLIVIDRASRRIVYDTINEHVPGMVFHDTIHTTHTVYLNPGRRIGVFSVAKDKQVSFSQGNLQYIQNQNIWKFADQQYEYIGAGNVKDGELANKIDLFGWSANNTVAPFGVSTSTNATDYAGEFVDWGVNEISGDAPNTWRTLKSEEWSYILDKRKNANKLRSKGSINGKRGYIILPDNWQLPNGVSFVVDVDNFTMNLDINSYTFEEWKIMENAGAIFLPTAGRRENLTIQYIANYCGIWTSDISEAKNLYFNFEQYQGIYSNNIGHTYHGRSIRLVYDTIVPKPSKRIGVFSVAKDKQVSFSQGNLQYVQSRDKWQFANTQYEYMGNRHFVNGQLADTIEYFGWSGKNSNAPWGISLSIELSDYKGEFLDWGTNVISGDVANTWRTLSNDELIYLCKKRENASQLLGLGYIGAISGLIILPDDWVTPEGLQFTPNTNDASLNQYTKEQWAIMENVGAVFIPATGYFNHKLDNMRGVNEKGYYRVSTLAEDGKQMYLVYDKDHITYSYSGNNNGNLFYAFPVRLVHDTIVPPPAPCETFEVNGVKFNMMCVEGGTMNIGRGEEMIYRQRPLHQVTISDFYIGQTEVTQELWQAVMGENPSKFQCDTCQQHPVDSVSWSMVQEFLQKLNKMTGKKFRLPTEAEWEYAARGGVKSKNFAYAGSDNRADVAWYGISEKIGGSPHPVALKRPNELGIYDMHGNVWEWVQDRYADSINIYPSVNPIGPQGKFPATMVSCGSGYYSSLTLETTWGWVGVGLGRSKWYGFRLALSNKDPFITIDINNYRFYMMHVEGGTFMMGAKEDDIEAEADEKPQHEVTLSDYYIGQTEVTQELWQAVMGTNPSSFKGSNLPVESVTWNECQQFVQKLSEMTGLHFRLPTEAEWEYAARGGNWSKGYTYAGSNNADSVAWHPNNCSGLQPVGQKTPNELGIYDMSGNLYEWCSDWYGAYSSEPQTNPQGPILSHDNYHIVRGGCWQSQKEGKDDIYYCGVTNRGYAKNASVRIGFRIVLDERPLPPTMPEYVDLGLSVKWATFNIGASAPEDYGDYFAWGEVEPKDEYSWANYKWCNGGYTSLTKYCSDDTLCIDGFTDGLTQLVPEDDAAHVNWGGNWRIPSNEEWAELRTQCQWTLTESQGVNGYEVKSKVNGNTIFIPIGGFLSGKNLVYDYLGGYWSTTLNKSKQSCALGLYLNKTENKVGQYFNSSRSNGFLIRPVYDDKVTLTSSQNE